MPIFTHLHHIIPKHMGGSNSPDNLVELTVEDHAIAHKVLFGLHRRWQDKIAWETLSGRISTEQACREAARLANTGRIQSPETRAKIRVASLNMSPETRAKISAAGMGNKYNLGNKHAFGKRWSPESRAKMVGNKNGLGNTNRLGHKLSPEHRAKILAANIGSTRTPETRANMRAAWVKRKQSAGK